MQQRNSFKLSFLSLSENESFARNVISCFAVRLNPSISEIADIKTAVSEAVTNAIVHGYPNDIGEIIMEAEIKENQIHIKVIDFGVGIDNVEKALEPFYTTKPDEERSGMGFIIMQEFMDSVKVESKKGSGTEIYMVKNILSNVGE